MGYGNLDQFMRNMNRVMGAVNTRLQRDLTMRSRVARSFSLREVAEFLGVDKGYLPRLTRDDPAFPEGKRDGRRRLFNPVEVLRVRALAASRPGARRTFLPWRRPGDPLPVVTFGAQKGGTGKSLSAAHFAQYLNLFYGLRVGVMDADPQATISLYFADADLPLFSPDTATLSTFMGVDDPGRGALRPMDGQALDAVWRPTPWPGVRLIPGGADIQNGDIGLYLLSRSGAPVYRVLRDAMERWSDDHPPRTQPEDLRDRAGRFDAAQFEAALTETLDVVVIDQQPSLTLMQLNGLIAADSVVIPQTMKGFDLATLATYVSSISEYLEFIMAYEDELEIGRGRHVVLPTIVQEANDRDTEAIVDLYRRAPRDVLQVWYARSDAIANAAERYMSIYEYEPPRSRQASAQAFTTNANAVNDALVERTLPHLETRGYAQSFVDDRWS